MIMKLHAKTWSEDPFTYSLLNHYVHKPWQNIKRAYSIVACHLQYGSKFTVAWGHVEGTAQHCTVYTLTLSLSTILLCKYKKGMWLCKSKLFHNFLMRVWQLGIIAEGRSWHYHWHNKFKPLQLLSEVACAPAFRYGKVVLLTKRLNAFLT